MIVTCCIWLHWIISLPLIKLEIHLQFVCQLICQVWDLQGKTVNINLLLWIIYYKQNHNISYLKNKIFYTVYSVRYIYWIQICLFVCFVVFNATFNNISAISWRSVLLVEKTGEPWENHRPVACHWQTLSPNVVHDSNMTSFFSYINKPATYYIVNSHWCMARAHI